MARLCHHLTVLGRETYGDDTEVQDSSRLRAINELQHRLTGFLVDILHGQGEQLNDAIVGVFFSERKDNRLQQLLASSFERISRTFVKESRREA